MTTEDEYYPYHVTVDIPKEATQEELEKIFDAVAEAAYNAQPADRNWDVFIFGKGVRPA